MWKQLVSFFILNTIILSAQTVSTTAIEFEPTDTLNGAYAVSAGKQHIFIASSFGSAQVSRDARLDSISGFMISEIVLVYSRYHKSENFNQQKLNDSRWNNLKQVYPSLFQNGVTRYRNVCQDVSSDTSSKKLTHGFYLYFENSGDSSKRQLEIAAISGMMRAMGIDTATTYEPETEKVVAEEAIVLDESKKKRSKFKKPLHTVDPHACRQPFYQKGLGDLDRFFKEHIVLTQWQKRKPKDLNAEVRLRLDYNGFIKNASIMAVNKTLVEQIRKALYDMEPWNPAVRNGVIVKSDVKFNLQYNPDGTMSLKGGITVAAFLSKCGTAPDEELFDFSKKEDKHKPVASPFEVVDNAVLRHVVERQPLLDSLLLVVDLTGSMGPYIAQVLDLMSELVVSDKPHVSCVTLFNDGDSKRDKNKVIGKTGGILLVKDDITLDRLGTAVLRSMKNGSGGDCMENNIEALIEGIDKCRECRTVVMVADNFATPRDGVLLSSVTTRVHWILCGSSDGVNVHYLDLVRANKGFLHTDKSDVFDLHLLKENETVTIDGYTYRLTGGKFKYLR